MAENNTLSKAEAVTLMNQGIKVTHEYFSSNEWITYGERGMILTEEGYLHSPLQFWAHRQSESFDTGWSIFKEN